MWPIFADLGVSNFSGSNFIAAYCNNWKDLIFKLFDLTAMGAFNEYHRAKKGIISKIHVFFSFYLTFSCVFYSLNVVEDMPTYSFISPLSFAIISTLKTISFFMPFLSK